MTTRIAKYLRRTAKKTYLKSNSKAGKRISPPPLQYGRAMANTITIYSQLVVWQHKNQPVPSIVSSGSSLMDQMEQTFRRASITLYSTLKNIFLTYKISKNSFCIEIIETFTLFGVLLGMCCVPFSRGLKGV